MPLSCHMSSLMIAHHSWCYHKTRQQTITWTKVNPYLCLHVINTLRLRQNGQHFADDTLKRIFFNENVWISIIISLMFVPKGLIYNIPALVQIMAWCRPGDKPLSEAMMIYLLTHICVTWPQWVNSEKVWTIKLLIWIYSIPRKDGLSMRKLLNVLDKMCPIFMLPVMQFGTDASITLLGTWQKLTNSHLCNSHWKLCPNPPKWWHLHIFWHYWSF